MPAVKSSDPPTVGMTPTTRFASSESYPRLHTRCPVGHQVESTGLRRCLVDSLGFYQNSAGYSLGFYQNSDVYSLGFLQNIDYLYAWNQRLDRGRRWSYGLGQGLVVGVAFLVCPAVAGVGQARAAVKPLCCQRRDSQRRMKTMARMFSSSANIHHMPKMPKPNVMPNR